MKFLYAAAVLLAGFVAAGFLEQNLSLVTLVYHGWRSPELPVSFHLVAAFAAGFLLALVLGLFSDLSGKVRLRRAEREARRLAAEVARLTGRPRRGTGKGEGEPAPPP